jgi:hypothetical protein
VKHVTDNVGKTVGATSRNLNKTVTNTTGGLKNTLTDTTTAAGKGDILGLGTGLTGGVGQTVSGAGQGLVSRSRPLYRRFINLCIAGRHA